MGISKFIADSSRRNSFFTNPPRTGQLPINEISGRINNRDIGKLFSIDAFYYSEQEIGRKFRTRYAKNELYKCAAIQLYIN